MTDRIRSSRRLIAIGAALLVAAAVVQILGVVPPLRSDTFALADPPRAAAGALVEAGFAVLLALALGLVAMRAAHSPRASTAILYVLGALAFLLGIPMAGLAPAFIVHGPSVRGAIFFMVLSGAAVLAAAGLVAAAASRLPGPAASEDTSGWKMRVAPAALLGIGLFFVMFLLGYGIQIPATVPAADYISGFLIAIALGVYSLLATYILLRGLPRSSRNFWIVVAMNAVLVLSVFMALIAEPDKSMGLRLLGIALIAGACSYGGLVLAARGTRQPGPWPR